MSTLNKKYLDYNGLSNVADKVKERLQKVTTMPASPNNGDAVLYVGTTTGNYTRGLVYIYDSSASVWNVQEPVIPVDPSIIPTANGAMWISAT